MKAPAILQVSLDNCTLGASYCQQNMAKGGVSIFIKKNLKFNQINIMNHCNEQDIECCVVQLESKFSNMYVLAIYSQYRAPTGDFELFLNKLESITNYLYKPKAEFVICGDININYLTESYHVECLKSVLTCFNLMSVVNFPTRIQNYSSTAIHNVFIDSSRKDNISIEPVINGLSDYARLLVIRNMESIFNYHNYRKQIRLINNDTKKNL
jgi:exonuclease III